MERFIGDVRGNASNGPFVSVQAALLKESTVRCFSEKS
jgi:hypothetical protein